MAKENNQVYTWLFFFATWFTNMVVLQTIILKSGEARLTSESLLNLYKYNRRFGLWIMLWKYFFEWRMAFLRLSLLIYDIMIKICIHLKKKCFQLILFLNSFISDCTYGYSGGTTAKECTGRYLNHFVWYKFLGCSQRFVGRAASFGEDTARVMEAGIIYSHYIAAG